jgi:hypothetical protein
MTGEIDRRGEESEIVFGSLLDAIPDLRANVGMGFGEDTSRRKSPYSNPGSPRHK